MMIRQHNVFFCFRLPALDGSLPWCPPLSRQAGLELKLSRVLRYFKGLPFWDRESFWKEMQIIFLFLQIQLLE
jgi:hypothetical protein